MIFKKCGCGADITTANCEKIEVNLIGMWLLCSACHSTAFIAKKTIIEKASAKANGDPFAQMEIDYYAQRLKEIEKG